MKTLKTYFASLTKEDVLFGNSKIFMKDYVEYRLNLAYRKRITYLRICAHKVATGFFRGRYLRKKQIKAKVQQTIGNFIESVRRIRYITKLRKAVKTIEKYWLRKLSAADRKQRRYDIMTLQTYFRRAL
jgi:hypothetical protein